MYVHAESSVTCTISGLATGPAEIGCATTTIVLRAHESSFVPPQAPSVEILQLPNAVTVTGFSRVVRGYWWLVVE